jgi:quinolinate synthase
MTEKEMIQEINRLRKEKNAVILAHFYQDGVIQDIADFTGDSLYLSQVAAKTDADVIVFAGVHFMAETAKILSPDKMVLLPNEKAGCPMADMITDIQLSRYKEKNPDRIVICYVNSTARVKALSDICVTSSNAEKIITAYKDQPIMYVPDKNLGLYLKEKYDIKDLEVWPGYCCVHDQLTTYDVDSMTKKYPNAKLIVHPEAPLDVLHRADFVGSTKSLLEYTINDESEEFIVGTEDGIIHTMYHHSPNKKFHILNPNLKCKDMKITTLEDVYMALKEERYQIEIPEDIREKAYIAIDRMMKMSD